MWPKIQNISQQKVKTPQKIKSKCWLLKEGGHSWAILFKVVHHLLGHSTLSFVLFFTRSLAGRPIQGPLKTRVGLKISYHPERVHMKRQSEGWRYLANLLDVGANAFVSYRSLPPQVGGTQEMLYNNSTVCTWHHRLRFGGLPCTAEQTW